MRTCAVFLVLVCVALAIAAAAQSFVAPPGTPKALLNKHLRTRAAANHGSGLRTMRWDSYLAKVAAIHARECKWVHTSASVRTARYNNLFSPKGHYSVGENMAMSTGWLANASNLFDGWSNECPKFVRQGCPAVTSTNFQSWGHYSQVIWSTSTRVGCAVQQCSTGNPLPQYGAKWTFLVCNYANSGNYLGKTYNYPGTRKYCSSSMCLSTAQLRLDQTASSSSDAGSSSHLPGWAIALIVVGVVAAAVVLTVAAVLIYRKQVEAKHTSASHYAMDS